MRLDPLQTLGGMRRWSLGRDEMITVKLRKHPRAEVYFIVLQIIELIAWHGESLGVQCV